MTIAWLAFLVLPSACGPDVDLPAGWEEAVWIEDFIQYECDGSPSTDDWVSTVIASAIQPGLRVIGDDLPFRCEQDVEGFYRVSGEAVDVLVQPVEMDPDEVARCDCLYRIEAGIPEAPPATVTLYRRWDNLNVPNRPVLVGSIRVP